MLPSQRSWRGTPEPPSVRAVPSSSITSEPLGKRTISIRVRSSTWASAWIAMPSPEVSLLLREVMPRSASELVRTTLPTWSESVGQGAGALAVEQQGDGAEDAAGQHDLARTQGAPLAATPSSVDRRQGSR